MVKAGLIIGIIMLLAGAGSSLLSPLCGPCLALVAGLVAGYLACVFEKPFASGKAAQTGALAGVISGVGALLGQLIGGIINAVTVTPDKIAALLRQFDLPMVADPSLYTIGYIAGGLCFGLFDIALMAGLGALGGILWYQISGKNTNVAV